MIEDFLKEINRLRSLNREFEVRAMVNGDSHGCQYSCGFNDALAYIQVFLYSYDRKEGDLFE